MWANDEIKDFYINLLSHSALGIFGILDNPNRYLIEKQQKSFFITMFTWDGRIN